LETATPLFTTSFARSALGSPVVLSGTGIVGTVLVEGLLVYPKSRAPGGDMAPII